MLYSACSFIGRLLCAAPDFLRDNTHFARTGKFAITLLPTPIAFILLSGSSSERALGASAALVGLSSLLLKKYYKFLKVTVLVWVASQTNCC